MAKPKRKFKTFTYENTVTWAGNRAGRITSDEKPEVLTASPPEFKGEDGKWSPEDLFVAAVNTCTMTTFLAFAFNKELNFDLYESSGEGVLERTDNGYQFTKIFIRPTIRVATEPDVELAEKILHDAHDKCLISNSITGKTIIEPDIVVNGQSSNWS